ncbi:MAG: DUF6445 family protein [Chlamydiales bacterium]|nr:DUF6445 family protein [Chlamydiales bacterium]
MHTKILFSFSIQIITKLTPYKEMLSPWIIDEEELFAPSAKLRIHKEAIGKHKVIIIDDFYKHPEAVRDFILKSPSSKWEGILYGYKGSRHMFCLNLEPMFKVLRKVLQKEFHHIADNNPPLFQSNIIIQKNEPAGPCAQPHTDEAMFAFSIFLNPNESCSGGTAFYKHKPSGIQAYPITTFDNKMPQHLLDVMEAYKLKNIEELRYFIYGDEKTKGGTQSYIVNSNQQWELLKVCEMKFNRMMLFEGQIFHSAYITPEMYIDEYRISQVGFFNGKPSS